VRNVILGAGGHGVVVAAALRDGGVRVWGFSDAGPGRTVDGLPVRCGDDGVRRLKPSAVRLYNGLGVSRDAAARRRLYAAFRSAGYRFPALKAKSAWVARSAELAEGAQVLTRAVVHPRARVGENAVVNTGAIVEHDCVVGAHAFVSPGAVLLGGVKVGEGALVGALAVVLPGVKVGAGARVGAGATVVEDVPAGATVVGTPARKKR
jgi:sugar O-acyltransferase (sialic acid O-acetyltransferase NeuD family)